MKHGMKKRRHSPFLVHQRRARVGQKAVIAFRPDNSYGIGPSGGLMAGYGSMWVKPAPREMRQKKEAK